MDTLVAAIIAWLVTSTGLPAPHEPPRVERVTPAQMQAVLARGRAASHGAASSGADAHAHGGEAFDVVAVYDDTRRTIYLPQSWSGRSPSEVSVLVHELVHHLQNVAGLKYACPQTREEIAYRAQDRWLARHGLNVFDEFQLDRMTLMLRTKCID